MRTASQRIGAVVAMLAIVASVLPMNARAETTADGLMISGWIPYWRDSEGIKDAKKNIKDIDTVNPFAYTIKSDGTIKDLAGLTDKEWKSFVKYARGKNVEIIPTVMTSDGELVHRLLSATSSRKEHIDSIISMVEKGKYDGVDIDYEGKKSETINYFSQFLKELKARLGEKLLTCAIEARTPPESLYLEVPKNIEYANDYKEIAKYCDRVALMTYDQQRADLHLNRAKNGAPYMPVSDADWVEKVIKLALKDIPREKLMVGVATYGHHYEVTVAPEWFKNYRRIGALNMPDILDLAKEYKVTPTRNKAGEMSYTYMPKNTVYKLATGLKVPKSTLKGNLVAAQALAHANKTGEEVMFNLVWYSDAEAIKQKIELAEKYNLRGVAIFKIDGEEDKNIWKNI